MPRFFPTELIKDKLLAYQVYTPLTLPPDAWIDDVAISLEDRLESWLSMKIGINSYTELYTTDDLGRIQIRKYPLVSIDKVEQLLNPIVDGTSGSKLIPSNQYNTIGVTNQRSVVFFGQPEATIQVTYTAGRAELFPELLGVMFATFMELLTHVTPPGYPDLGFLKEPTRDYTSISLPSGLSKSYELGKPSGSGSGGIASKGTIEDRLFAPLSKYRRLYIL